MSRLLDQMNADRLTNQTTLNKDNFYIREIGDLKILMVKTTEEEMNEEIINQRVLIEPNIKRTTFEKVEEIVKLKKDGTPDKRYLKKNGKA